MYSMYSIFAALLLIHAAIAAPKKNQKFYIEDIELVEDSEFARKGNCAPCLNSSGAASTSVSDFIENYEAKESAQQINEELDAVQEAAQEDAELGAAVEYDEAAFRC